MDIINKGLIQIENMKFHSIEGGFGEGKKSILVKEIAEIHSQPLGEINRRINDNKTRFKDFVDIIDLKSVMAESHSKTFKQLLDGVYTQNALNASKNIYILSERGYSKLLKLLEDDFAWEQYDKLVDCYFSMRKTISEMYWIKEQEEKDQITKEINLLKPAAEFGNALGNCKDTILLRDYVKILKNDDINITQKEMFKWLEKNRFIYRDKILDQWIAYKTYVNQGLFKIKETLYSTNSGQKRIGYTIKLTGKGQKYFYEKLKSINLREAM